MVYIEINGNIFNFIGANTPINFNFDVFKDREYQKQGTLFLQELYLNKDLTLEEITSVSLIGNDLTNNNLLKYEFKDHLSVNLFKSKRNLYTLVFSFKDVFKEYDNFTKFLYSVFNPPLQTYDCFTTSYLCNLKCPYCIEGIEHKNFKNRMNYDITKHFIQDVMRINFKNIHKRRNTIRLMGGETFLNLDTFDYTFKKQVEFITELKEPIEELWIYTNYTTNNIKEVLNYLNTEVLKHVNHIMLVITSDSLDYKKSYRITSKELMNKFIDNIKLSAELLKNNKKITLASNIMYIDYETTLNIAKTLYDMGVTYIQLAYDEYSSLEDAESSRINLSKIFNELQNYGIPRLKPNLGDLSWVHFSILTENETEIYRSKLAIKADYIISKLNDY